MDGTSTNAASKGSLTGWFGFLLVLLALVVEGFDLQAANFASTSLVEHFQISHAEIGPLLSASLLGLLFGAILIAPLGDRIGRRRLIILCCLTYGLLSLAAAFATSLNQITALRFLIGIGLGGVLPNALALAGELAPARLLASATGLVSIGITFGGTLAGATAGLVMPRYGWSGVFMTGGILPLVIAALLWVALPESPALHRERATSASLKRVGELLTPQDRWKTLAIWVSFALVLMIAFLLSGWIPLVVKDQGYSTQAATWIATAGHAGGIAGGVIASLALARWGWRTVTIFAVIASASLALLAIHNWALGMMLPLIIVQGFFTVGTQNALNGSASATYPPHMRALGLGWALGIGRIGAIAGPLVGSAASLLGLGAARYFFALPIAPLLIAALLALYLNRTTNSSGE